MAPRKKKTVSNSPSPQPDIFSDLRQGRGTNSQAFLNGLQEAVLGFNPGGPGTQLQQVDTMQLNLRWYLISNFRQLLSQAYAEKGIIQTICDVPVADAFRGSVDFKSKQLDPEQNEELKAHIEEQDDLAAIAETETWNRLFGGAGTLVMTDQDPETPFDIDAISEDTPVELRGVDMWELYWSKQSTQDYSAAIDQQDLIDVDFYNYYGQQVHKSRVWKRKGIPAPSFIRPRLRGWGLSIVESIVDSMNQYLKAQNVIFEVLDEFKVDVYKLKNFAATLLNPQGTAVIQQRIAIANQQKNYQNALTLDGEDDFIQKQLVFTGIADTLVGIRMGIASELKMPMSKIFGISSTGFSSGEDDIENYNAMVESQVRQKQKFNLIRLGKIRCQQKFGFVPDDLTVEFKPLRVLSSEQEENVKTQRFTRVFQTWTSGGMTTEEFKSACNKDNLLNVQIDTSVEELPPIGAAEGSAAPEGKKSKTQAPEADT